MVFFYSIVFLFYFYLVLFVWNLSLYEKGGASNYYGHICYPLKIHMPNSVSFAWFVLELCRNLCFICMGPLLSIRGRGLKLYRHQKTLHTNFHVDRFGSFRAYMNQTARQTDRPDCIFICIDYNINIVEP